VSNVFVDLLAIDKGTVTAPAGCGKTYLIADALRRHKGEKPILLLTHTNAGVVALRKILFDAGVSAEKYRLLTIDGWAIKLVSTFPQRSEIKTDTLLLRNPADDYLNIRKATGKLLKSKHIDDALKATYSRIIVDEYQDCSIGQHFIVCCLSIVFPTCLLGDPLQAIFDFGGDKLASWEDHVVKCFPVCKTLNTPWRWNNQSKNGFGSWLLDARSKLEAEQPIDLGQSPDEVKWIQTSETTDFQAQAQVDVVNKIELADDEKLLIIGESKNPKSQRKFASKIKGAVAIESVDLKDFVEFAKNIDFTSIDSLKTLVDFAGTLMAGVGAPKMLKRIDSLNKRTARKEPTEVEKAALQFLDKLCPRNAGHLLSEINRQSGVRVCRPAILRACLNAFQQCASDGSDLHEVAVNLREQNRLIGRPSAKKSVGSTLLLKGLEAEVCVILNADRLNKNNLYVAMTRGSRRLIIFSPTRCIKPS